MSSSEPSNQQNPDLDSFSSRSQEYLIDGNLTARINYASTRTSAKAITWSPDMAFDFCTLCASLFTNLRRRHHCRQCGSLICSECSQVRIRLEGYSKRQRVCSHCHKAPKQLSDKIRQWLLRKGSLCFVLGNRSSRWWDWAHRRSGSQRPTIYSKTLYRDMKSAFRIKRQDRERSDIWIHIEMISKDTDRTFGASPQSADARGPLAREVVEDVNINDSKNALVNVLGAFVCFNRSVGYCQGMCFLTSILLYATSWNEDMSFWLLLALIERYEFSALYSPGLPDLGLRFFQLDELLRKHSPDLHAHLSERSIHPSLYASGWLMTLFSNFKAFGLESVLKVFDLFFCDGWKAAFRVCLGILYVAQEKILIMDDPEAIIEILHAIHQHFPILSDPTNLVDLAMMNKVTNSMLEELKEEYNRSSTVTDEDKLG